MLVLNFARTIQVNATERRQIIALPSQHMVKGYNFAIAIAISAIPIPPFDLDLDSIQPHIQPFLTIQPHYYHSETFV